MQNYALRRLLAIIPMVVGISWLAFLLITLSPSDPAEVALRVNEITPTPEAIKSMRVELGLDKPFGQRYVEWLQAVLRGDFGRSYINKRPVIMEIKQALPATLMLAAVALTLILVIGLTLGVWCAVHRGSWGERLVRCIVFLGTALPSFCAGLIFIRLFAVDWNLFPTSGMDGPSSVVLPAFTLALTYISTYVRLIRNRMIENEQENYVAYARAGGLKERVVLGYILKNSFQSSLTALGMTIPKLLAGAVVVENVFAWPGIGRLCVMAIFNRDYPIIQAYVFLMALMFVICNLGVDLCSAWLDPRLRQGE